MADGDAPQDGAPSKIVLIAPAMAVRKSLYHHFAGYLSQRGFGVLTFDYRGTGDSRAGGKDEGNLSRWAELDLEGALQYLERTYPRAKVCVVAHSVSGHLLPLAPSSTHTVDAALIVATPAASWRKWPLNMRPLVWALCALILPLVVAVRGFLPGRFLGGPEDLTGEVVREWAAWGRATASPGELRAKHFRIPVGLLSFDDDRYGPQATVGALGAAYRATTVDHRHVCASEVGGALGHFGWANAPQGRHLWDGLATWIERTLSDQPAALLAPALVHATAGAPAIHTVSSPLRPPSPESAA